MGGSSPSRAHARPPTHCVCGGAAPVPPMCRLRCSGLCLSWGRRAAVNERQLAFSCARQGNHALRLRRRGARNSSTGLGFLSVAHAGTGGDSPALRTSGCTLRCAAVDQRSNRRCSSAPGCIMRVGDEAAHLGVRPSNSDEAAKPALRTAWLHNSSDGPASVSGRAAPDRPCTRRRSLEDVSNVARPRDSPGNYARHGSKAPQSSTPNKWGAARPGPRSAAAVSPAPRGGWRPMRKDGRRRFSYDVRWWHSRRRRTGFLA